MAVAKEKQPVLEPIPGLAETPEELELLGLLVAEARDAPRSSQSVEEIFEYARSIHRRRAAD